MKLSPELIEAYLDGSLSPAETAKLKAWLQGHPADLAKVQRQSALRSLLAESALQPSAAQSRKMWANIKAQVQAQNAPAPVLDLREPWYAFLFQPWGKGLSFGVTAAAVLALAFVFRPWQTAPQNAPVAAEMSIAAADVAPAAAKAKESEQDDVAPARKRSIAAPSKAESQPMMADATSAPAMAAGAGMSASRAEESGAPSASSGQAFSNEPTEVEKALADSGVDGMIDAYLAAQRQGGGMRGAALASAQPTFERRSLSSPLAGLTRSRAVAEEDAVIDSKTLSTAQGHPDNNGFWDWRPAAVAMNRRDWAQVRLELESARTRAAESVERSFAGSALTLLSAPGAPLDGQTTALPATGELRVLGAGRWQLVSESRLARFSEGVSARLPGFRAVGDSLLLDLTFDRGTFSPGTRFTRVSGDAPAEVLDAQGQSVSADEFNAPAGATYNVSGRQLKLR